MTITYTIPVKPTTLTTSLSGEGKSGEKITVNEGASVTDKATISGENAAKAGGEATYKNYSDPECKKLAKEAGFIAVSNGSAPASEAQTLSAGTYYWQAEYLGDETNEESKSECGAEVLTVLAVKKPTFTTTQLSGEGQSFDQIAVKEGTSVTDQAFLKGENASGATGTVTYKVYSDPECKKLVTEAGTVAVSEGHVPLSEAENLPAGTYYWQAEYSGDKRNEGSKNECGGEILTVLKPAFCGKTTVGKTSDELLAHLKRVNRCVLPVAAKVYELTEYLSPTKGVKGQQPIKGVIHADDKGKPGALLGVTDQLVFKSTSAVGWHHMAFATPLNLAASTYWIGTFAGNSAKVASEHYDPVANAEEYNSNTYTKGPSNPFGSFKHTDEEVSLYATYTPELCPSITSALATC